MFAIRSDDHGKFATSEEDNYVSFLHRVDGNSHVPRCGKEESLLFMMKHHCCMKVFGPTAGFVKATSSYGITSSHVPGPKFPKRRSHRSDAVPWNGVV